MLRDRQVWWQGTDQVDTDYRNKLLQRKGRLVSEFRSFFYGDNLVWELRNNLAHTFT
jgi:hypothetical protein